MTPEKQIQNKILNYLSELENKKYPIFFERRQAGGFSYKKGIPDIYAVINGIHVEIEVKKQGGKLSPMQEKFRDLCELKNIKWILVDNLDVLKNYLKNHFNI